MPSLVVVLTHTTLPVSLPKMIVLTARLCASLLLLLEQQPPVGQSLLIHEVSRSHTHNDAPQSVGLLCTNDQLVAQTYT